MAQIGIMIAKRGMAVLLLSLLFTLTACDEQSAQSQVQRNQPAAPSEVVPLERPAFSADSAYAFIEKQVAFGPRVPGTGPHVRCARWLTSQLEVYGAKVYQQPTTVTAWNGDQLSMVNIIGAIRPELPRRVMLSAHWDTRPIADQDDEDPDSPIPGANDGGSGVGVLLEIARQLQLQAPEIGVDIALWDAEDYGTPGQNDSYCLGSQHWVQNPHLPNYQAQFGINLDMVGAAGADFPKEGYSMQYAPDVVARVWSAARSLGYSQFFSVRRSDPVVDDHYYMNQYPQLKAINVIDYRAGTGFFEHWHTHEDDLEQIDRGTLQAVGETVLAIIYQMQ